MQELLPEYVALSELPDSVPWPDAVLEQPAPEPSAPPAGTDKLKVRDVPEMVPLSVPVALTPLVPSVIDNVPEKPVPLCVSVHDIRPLPSESLAVPDHEPFTLALVVGVLGVDGDVVVELLLPPPLQPAATAASANAATDIRVSCVKIIGSSADSTMCG